MKKRYLNTSYIIYDDGRCYSELSNKFLTPQMSARYPTYNLTLNGKKKKIKIHRMVAETFLPKKEGKEIVNHIDGDTHNFKLDNLEWVTLKENSQHAIITGLRASTNQNGIFLDVDQEIDNEEWRLIKDYSNYLVSNYGRILNKNTNRLLKGCISNNGYPEVNLWQNNKGKTLLIHILVYSAFAEDYNLDGFVINHIDGNKKNNDFNNLEKVTYQENNYHAEYVINTHVCAKQVAQLNKEKQIIQKYPSIREATKITKINNISRAIKTSRMAGGYYWEFI